MRLSEAITIANNPEQHAGRLIIAHLKLEVAALRAFPSSQRQRELRQLIGKIETMPRELWVYVPKGKARARP